MLHSMTGYGSISFNSNNFSFDIELKTLNSKFFDKIVVSTDSEEISKISLSQGVEVPFLRPHSLSDDNTSVIEVVRHAINFFKDSSEDCKICFASSFSCSTEWT